MPQTELRTQQSFVSGGLPSKKSNPVQPIDKKSVVSVSDEGDDHRRHRHHHHHRRHHSHRRHNHDHHHSRHHHRHHHHHHRHNSHSSCSQCSHRSYSTSHHAHQHAHHHSYVAPLPKIIIARPPKIITPTPTKTNTAVYRDAGNNTGLETKIMRDSSITADLEELPTITNNRFDQIPVVRRTIIVEPYPAQPSSQIIVKPRADMIGKIRLAKNTTNDDNQGDTVIYPTTAFLTKKSKPKKKSTVINNNLIEDLQLDDIHGETTKKKKNKINTNSIQSSIKNAFYN